MTCKCCLLTHPYALGVVFYQMLTGELPKGDLVPPSSRMSGIVVDVRLDEVVLRALEQNPALRYQHVSEVKTLCETIATTPPKQREGEQKKEPNSTASPAAPPGPPAFVPRLSRTAVIGAVCAAIGLIGLLSLFLG